MAKLIPNLTRVTLAGYDYQRDMSIVYLGVCRQTDRRYIRVARKTGRTWQLGRFHKSHIKEYNNTYGVFCLTGGVKCYTLGFMVMLQFVVPGELYFSVQILPFHLTFFNTYQYYPMQK